MNSRNYGYQYETSPRKIKPDYNSPRKKVRKTTKKSSTATKNRTNIKNKKQEEIKKQKKLVGKTKGLVFVKCLLLFGIIFFMLIRNSQLSEAFSKIQDLKAQITSIEKENDQLEISIQNNSNINNIEQKARELLGMQKISPKQIVYINLPKKDYVEPKTEEVIIEEEKSFFDNLLEKIKNIF